jgi:hypothetical protein
MDAMLREHEAKMAALEEEHCIRMANLEYRHQRWMMLLQLAMPVVCTAYFLASCVFCWIDVPDFLLFMNTLQFGLFWYIGLRMFFYHRAEYREASEALYLASLGVRTDD